MRSVLGDCRDVDIKVQVDSLRELASAQTALQEYDAALPRYQQLILLVKDDDAQVKDLAQDYLGLAGCYQGINKPFEAMEPARQALRLFETEFPKYEWRRLYTLERLAETARDSGNLDDSIIYTKQAIEYLRACPANVFGEEDKEAERKWRLSRHLDSLSILYRSQGKEQEAEKIDAEIEVMRNQNARSG